jgi:hypothetical protein
MAAQQATKVADGINLGIANRIGNMFTITGPTSYTHVTTGSPPSNGQTVTAQQLGLKAIDGVIMLAADTTGVNGVEYIPLTPTSGILLWFVCHTGAEVSDATNLSAISVKILALGR